MRAVSPFPSARRPVWPAALLAGGLAACLGLLAPAPAQAATPQCDDHLVTHTPTGTDGDGSAVAITSQLLDADQPGWVHAQWAAAEGTELTAVLAVTVDEEVRDLAPEPTGFIEDVLSLTFCGTAATDDAGEPDDAEDDAPPADGTDEETEASDDTVGGTDEPGHADDGSSSTDVSSDAGAGGSTDTSRDGGTDGDVEAVDDPAPTSTFEVTAELPEADLRDDPEVEVLSVTMARADDDASDAQGQQAAHAAATESGSRAVGASTVTVVVTGLLLALAVLTFADWRRRRQTRQEAA